MFILFGAVGSQAYFESGETLSLSICLKRGFNVMVEWLRE